MSDLPSRRAGPRAVAPPLPRARDGASAREIAERCAVAAAEILRAAAGGSRAALTKGATSGGRNDIITVTDRQIEHAVRAVLADAYPEHAVLGEETGGDAGAAEWLWIVDPIDGTRNFSAGIPWVGFNLALYQSGEPRLALTLDPFRDERFYAEAGAGTSLNGIRVEVTSAGTLQQSFVGLDLGLDDARGRKLLAALQALFPGVQAIRVPGTAALGLAYVAAGRLDAYMHPSAQAWDFAPGVLLVREAGGRVSELSGAPISLASNSVVAAAPGVHAELVAWFRHVVEE